MPNYSNHAPRDAMLRVRVTEDLAASLAHESHRAGVPLSEYLRARMGELVHDAGWRPSPPFNGAYWVSVPGTVGATLAVVSQHTGRSYAVSFPFWESLKAERPADDVPELAEATWSGPLVPPVQVVAAHGPVGDPLSRRLIIAREAVRRGVIDMWGPTEEAILRRVDRCVETLVRNAAKEDYKKQDGVPTFADAEPWILDAVADAVALPPKHKDERWGEMLGRDTWGIVEHGRWDLLEIAEKVLGSSI